MIIDVHTHAPTHRDAVPASERRYYESFRQDRQAPSTVSWAEYLQGMKGVDCSIVFGVRMKGAPDNVNDSTAAFVRSCPEKLIGFLSVHPEEGDPVQEIERGVFQLGLKGIKLIPNSQNFDPLGKQAFRVYEAAQRMGLPILFHQGTLPFTSGVNRYGHPLLMDEVAIAFPKLRVVMAHIGHPWQVDCLMVIRKHPHVYADISAQFLRPWSQYNALRLATEWNVLHKLLFGSDFPVATPEEVIAGTRTVNQIVTGTALPRVPEDAIEEIIHRDSLKLLGLAA